MAKQLNIFLENKPGRLKAVTELLYQNKINIRALSLQDRQDFGVLKIVVDKPDEAHIALTQKGFACALKDILAILMDDKPGGLHKIASLFVDNKINIQDAYAFVIESKKQAVLCVEIKDPKTIKAIIKKEGYKILEDEQLYEL